MKREELRGALRALRDELRAAESTPEVEELRPRIEELHDQLEEASEHPDESFGARLREALDRFETRHARLTLLVGRVAESLAEMGL